MKKITTILVSLAIAASVMSQDIKENQTTYNNNQTNEKELIAYTASTFDDKFSGFVTGYGALSPSHGYNLHIGAAVGVVYKFGEVAVSAFPGVSGTNPTHFVATTLGYRFTFNKLYTFTPRVGLYARAQDKGFDFKDGNHAIYGGEVARAVANNIRFTVLFYDIRHKEGRKITKLVGAGIQYIF